MRYCMNRRGGGCQKACRVCGAGAGFRQHSGSGGCARQANGYRTSAGGRGRCSVCGGWRDRFFKPVLVGPGVAGGGAAGRDIAEMWCNVDRRLSCFKRVCAAFLHPCSALARRIGAMRHCQGRHSPLLFPGSPPPASPILSHPPLHANPLSVLCRCTTWACWWRHNQPREERTPPTHTAQLLQRPGAGLWLRQQWTAHVPSVLRRRANTFLVAAANPAQPPPPPPPHPTPLVTSVCRR